MIKALQRKDLQIANKEYWDQQIKWASTTKEQDKIIDLRGGTQANFLKKIFKHNAITDKKVQRGVFAEPPTKKADGEDSEELSMDDKPKSRLQFNADEVKDFLQNQIKQNEAKKK